MSYDATKHNVFSERCKNFSIAVQNLREEAASLDAIYVNETMSGADAAFTDTPYATEQEHKDLINLLRDFESFMTNQAVTASDRTQLITPFLANG